VLITYLQTGNGQFLNGEIRSARASSTYSWRLCLRNPPPLGRVILDASLPFLRAQGLFRSK
jgi:hypothetical protein